jgi:hypothetical protein
MRERVTLDRDYSRRLTKLSDTFLGNKSGKDVGNEGFFSIVAGSSAAVSRQFEEFASELEADRWPDLEATVATIGSLMRKCDVEALELWNRTRAMESSAVQAFKAYNLVYSASCCKGVESIERIANVLAQADESCVLETGSLSDLLSGGIYGGALSETDRESGTTPSSSSFTLEAGECDVYSCVHQYRVLVSKSLRGHDTIERFTNFIERDTKNIAANVATVVRRATDMFCDHQGSMWSDLGREMCFKGSATRQRAQSMLVAVTELGADQLDELPTAATKRLVSVSVTSDGSGDGGGGSDGSSMPPLAPPSLPHGSEDGAMNMQSAVDEESDPSLAAATHVGDGDGGSLVSAAGATAKFVFNMKDLPPESRTVVAAGHFLVASADDAIEEGRGDTGLGAAVWSAVRLIATADGYVHFFRDSDDNGRSSDASDEARGLFSGRKCPVEPVRSVRLERAAVRLAMLPGHDEALEISVHKDFMGSSVTAMLRNTGGPGGSSGAGSGRRAEERWECATRLVVHADGTGLDSGSESMRDWIRLLHNPLADPSLAPPHLD